MAEFAETTAAIAAFLASRGATKIPQGAANLGHVTGRDWHRAARGEAVAMQTEIDRRRYVTGADGVEHCQNGLGEWIY